MAEIQQEATAVALAQDKHDSTFLEKLHLEQTHINEIDAQCVDIQQICSLMESSELKQGNFLRFQTEFFRTFQSALNIKQHVKTTFNSFEDLVNECVLNVESTDSSKIDTATNTIKTLKQQIKRAEDMLESSIRREELAKMEQRQLKHDITNLGLTIKQGVGLSAAQERTINDLVNTKEQSTKDLEHELEKIVTLRNGLVSISEKIEGAETEKRHLDREIYTLKDRNTAKKIEIDNEIRNKDKLEQELREQRVVVTIKSQEVVGKQDSVNRATEDISIIEAQIRQQKQMVEKLLRDQESLGIRTVKLQQDYDEQMSETTKLQNENDSSNAALKRKEDELLNHKAEVKKVMRMKDILIKKNRMLEDQKIQADLVRKGIRTDNEARMIEIERRKHQIEATKKSIDDLTRERDILKSDLGKTQSESSRVAQLLTLQKQHKSNLELEIARFKRDSTERQKELKLYQRERDEALLEYKDMQDQCLAMMQMLKEKEASIFDYKRIMLQSENKLKHQQNLYEGVQSDRNLVAKQLIESQSEIAEMKRNLRIMNFQINGYKDDINSKESGLQKELIENQKLSKDTLLIEEESTTLKNQNQLAQSYIKSQMLEQVKLDQFVKEAELERSRQENALSLLISERDHLSTQLLRKNDELAGVYDQIKTQQSSLIRGQVYYTEKLQQINLLRQTINQRRSESNKLSEETSGISVMKRTITHIQSQMVQEKMRIKALEQELDNPINVHRWRKLEGSNPQNFKQLQLVHLLQKKLIEKSKEEREKEGQIETKERLYLHLKQILAKQTGPETVEQTGEFGKALHSKKQQLRHMDTELNMYQAQVHEYEYSIAHLDKGLAKIKTKFLEMYTKRMATSRNSINEIPIDKLPALPEKEDEMESTQDRSEFSQNMSQGAQETTGLLGPDSDAQESESQYSESNRNSGVESDSEQ